MHDDIITAPIMTICQKTMELDHENKSRYSVFGKMEKMIKLMQQPAIGIVFRNKKNFMASISQSTAFTGSDIVDWLKTRYTIEDSREALYMANLLCNYGYVYPTDLKSFIIKDDRSAEYKFQIPYYWPFCSESTADSMEYAIYLQKRSLRNKNKHDLEPHEREAFEKLLKFFCDKKEFIELQAKEQIKEIKKKKRPEKLLGDQQERAFWRTHRPPKGQINCLEEGPKRNFAPSQIEARRKRNKDFYKKEIVFLKRAMDRPRMKFSKVFECFCTSWDLYHEYDPLLDQSAAQPSNPWISEDTTMWELNDDQKKNPTELRVKKWSLGFHELISDKLGRQEFEEFLQKEYSQENIHFWQQVESLKKCPNSKVKDMVETIQRNYLDKGADCEVNVDSKTMEQVHQNLQIHKCGPRSRYVFEPAQEHIYNLMKKDSYPRYLRSEQYKQLLATAKQPFAKRKFFSFGTKQKPQPEKQLQRPQTPSPKPMRRKRSTSSERENSDVSATNSPVHTGPQHSYSTGNLKEMDKFPTTQSFKGSDNSLMRSGHSPSAVRRRSDEPRGNMAASSRRKSNLEVPRQYPFPTDKRKSENVPCLNLNVPKSNSIAPWEDKQ